MFVLHIALGGCLTAPAVRYGLTEDTGGHIAYVLGAAMAQAERTDVSHVDIVTRAFDAPELGAIHACPDQRVSAKLSIRRLVTANTGYLAKEALEAEEPAMAQAFHELLADGPRRPDVIHAHFADALRVARPAAQALGIPLIYTPHSLGIDKKQHMGAAVGAGLSRRIASERAALQQAEAVIVSSRDEAERQIEAYGVDVAARVHRIAPGVCLPRPLPDEAAAARALVDNFFTNPDRPLILAIARPVARKNLQALINAYAADPRLRAAANLAIVAGQRGPGIADTEESREVIAGLMRQAARPDLEGRIALPERHDPEVVPALYRLAAARRGVFVNPALHEPFGLTLLEAGAAGLPVVATREGGPQDILRSIGHGVTVDPCDTRAIGDAIHDLLEDGDAWTEASDAALRGIGAFDWSVWAARAQRVYARVARRARPVVSDPVPAPDRFLACDIDGTLTGCPDGAARFAAWAAHRRMPFAVATGRSISEARVILANWDLPEPDLFITAVGSEIHRPDASGRLHLCQDYAAHLDEGWDRAAALAVIATSGVPLQAEIEQRRWKLACFGDATQAQILRDAFAAAGIAARIIDSHGRLIDILPPAGGKAAAIGFAAARFGLDLGDCIAAGDSGNDIDMLQTCGSAILVSNALPEVGGLTDAAGLYRCRTPHANGVLEGLAHFAIPGAQGPREGRNPRIGRTGTGWHRTPGRNPHTADQAVGA
ncbi:hypothetical protein LCGC14_0631870 [marine sediment metagenome]|uniref:sucrose-phosphate synthase n=1 Tax=marine sediment metagenome TaxID=412755 RepID=A0A0F9R6Z6_9ZZZZ